MTDVDRQKLQEAVKANSSLSLEQIEAMFGRVTEANKLQVWRYLTQMSPEQQKAIWDCHWYLKKSLAPDVKITSVERILEAQE